MKAVILAGGLGTRLTEETGSKPKPMIEIGGYPLLWHIMRGYSHFGIHEFIICLGYKGYMIKEYFLNYHAHSSDLSIDLEMGTYEVLRSTSLPWKVTLINTGFDSMTGGRLKRIAPLVEGETFCMTYGDGVSNIDIAAEIAFHQKHGKLATVAAVQPPGRFGVLGIEDHMVHQIKEKPKDEFGWINGGFFILDSKALELIDGDHTVWEQEPLCALAESEQLCAFIHEGFWKSCDTLRDLIELQRLWDEGAPWKIW